MTPALRYSIVTPARNEAENLGRLADALAAQSALPGSWTIVDNGSTDGTAALAAELADAHPWVRVLSTPGERDPVRGRPIVRAIHAAAAAAAADPPDVFVNVDADVSFEADFFERLLGDFASDPELGIASGTCYELDEGSWRPRHNTGSSVWGATRAYRWECLQQVLPLEERLGWDGIDELKANARGWRTRTLADLPFRHHRPEGVRDGARVRARREQGRTAHYMGYRAWYLGLRALRWAPRDPAALAMLWGYAESAARREPRCEDPAARSYLRRTQSLRFLPLRALEAFGFRA